MSEDAPIYAKAGQNYAQAVLADICRQTLRGIAATLVPQDWGTAHMLRELGLVNHWENKMVPLWTPTEAGLRQFYENEGIPF